MPKEGSRSRVLHLVFADLVESTALKTARGDQRAGEVIARARALLVRVAGDCGGRIVDFAGDGCFLTFETASAAVLFGLGLQEVHARELDLPRMRVGIHVGEVTEHAALPSGEGHPRVEGLAVDLASRIQGIARPGQVLVSSAVAASARQRLAGEVARRAIRWQSHGSYALKGASDPLEIVEVGLEGIAPFATPGGEKARRVGTRRGARHLALGALALLAVAGVAGYFARFAGAPGVPAIRSIAVLPLENLSGDPEQEYFADGMTEALIGELARIGALSVISRTSVMQYKGERKPLPEIAEELGVEGILEGTVMRSGDRVRIQAQLIDARTDHHLWNDRFDRDLSDVLALQADVARAVAEQVRLELTPQEHARLGSRSVDPAAYDAYLRGRALVGPVAMVQGWAPGAIEQLERAVALDPGLAEAWAWIANVRMGLGAFGLRLHDRKQYPKAREAAQRALDLDGHLGIAHAVLGYILMQNAWDFAAAGREFERAFELSPGDPWVVNGFAWYLLLTGRTEEGLALSERLPRIAPYDIYYRGDHFRHLRFARQYERAVDELARVREVDPDFTDPIIEYLYFALGRLEDAHRAALARYELCGKPCDPRRKAELRGWAEGGWEGSKRAVTEVLASIEGFSPNAIAMNYSLVGDTDEVFAWLEEGYRQRDPLMVNIKGNPSFDPIRSDPRFDDLVRRIGFPAD